MADFTPTPSQKLAVETRGGTVLVSAGAGSGKTSVLTRRLMSRILDPDDPRDVDSFLVITFTKAAAAELKSRILDALGEALAAQPDNRRLRRQSALCRQAQIGTIHAFCQNVLRENSHALGIAPDFRVADDERARTMKSAVLDRVMDQRYEQLEKYPGFAYLADTVGSGRDDGRLTALVLSLHDKMQCHARPERWAQAQLDALALRGVTDAGITPWGRELMDGAAASAEYWAGEMERLGQLMARGPAEILAAYGDSVSETAMALRDFVRALSGSWDGARARAEIPFPRLGGLRDSPDAALSELVKTRRDACKKAAAGFAERFSEPSAALLEELSRTRPAMEALLALTMDFDRAYAAEKRRRGLVDFADLEHLAARLLTEEDGAPTPLAAELSRRYTEIMVDEYQDVSEVQDLLFRAVSREGKNLFLVGDVKQAIYRFRLADPGIFLDKYNAFADADKAGEGEPRRVFLRENFRSRREIIDGANRVFAACMSEKLGETRYDENAALICGADYPGSVPAPELLLLDTRGDGEESPDRTRLEAGAAADRILALMAAGTTVTDHGQTRPLRWGDVAILLRSANAVGPVYRRALLERGIPAQSAQGGDFFTAIEVSCVLSLLAVIDNPHQDVPLIAALRSPAFGFTPDELSAVRAADRRGDYYTALVKAAESDRKCAAFLDTLTALRALAPDLTLSELLGRVYNELDLMAVCSAMRDGAARRQNLLLLAGCAKKFEAAGYRGLHRFNLWLRRMADRGEEPEGARSAPDAVQILSIHKSKGLEFPVVLLCDTARRFNRRDTSETMLVHPALGLGPKVTDLEARVEYPTLARRAIRQRAEREMLSEELRLLYVALTRAKERLIVTAAMADPAGQLEKLRPLAAFPMASEVLTQCQSPAQWLMCAALCGGDKLTLTLAAPAAAAQTDGEAAAETPPDPETAAELSRRLAFVYPHQAAQTLPSKVTATELKAGAFQPDGESAFLPPAPAGAFRAPAFSREKPKLTAAQRGTATHAALQVIDFAAAAEKGAAAEIAELSENGVLTAAEAAAVDAAAIDRLLASPLGARMLAAETLNREFRFSVLLPAEKFFPGGQGEEVLLQGAIDCWFEEEGGVTVVDYKTDRVAAAEVPARAALYAPQLRAYSLALTAMTGRNVRDAALVFLHSGEIIFREKNP